MADDKTALTGEAVLEEGLDDWRWVLNKLVARFDTGDFNAGTALVTQIAEVADEANHHPDVDLRYPHVTVSLMSHDVEAITQRDVRLARRISELASAAGVAATQAPDVLELALDTPDGSAVKPFYAALLGYQPHPDHDDDLRDGADRTPEHLVPGERRAGAGPAAVAPGRERPARGGRGAAPGGARRRGDSRQRRECAGVLGGRGRGRQPVLHLHLAGPIGLGERGRLVVPGRVAEACQNVGIRPTIRDGWQSELSTDDVQGHAGSMQFQDDSCTHATRELRPQASRTRVDPSSADRLEGFFVGRTTTSSRTQGR